MANVTSGIPLTVAALRAAELPAADSPARTLRQSVAAAVRVLNDVGHAGTGSEVTFSVDPGSHRPVVKVVVSETRQVLQQWPSEYALQLAADYERHLRDSR